VYYRPAEDSHHTSALDALNEKLTVLEDKFSFTLGEGSRCWRSDPAPAFYCDHRITGCSFTIR